MLVVVGADADPRAARVASEQARALAARGLEVGERVLEPGARPFPPPAAVIHLHPGPGTSRRAAEALARRAPLVLHLFDPVRVGAALVPVAARVVVPSRTGLVHLLDRVDLRPRQGRILFPGTSMPRARRRAWSGQRPLCLLHLGPRDGASGLVDLARALADLPPGRVELRAAGPGSAAGDAALRALAGATRLRLEGPAPIGASPALARGAHLAPFPSRRAGSYALGVDDALALGLPVWVAGAQAVHERHDASAFTVLPAADPDAWREGLAAWLADPSHARVAHERLPSRVPSTAQAAEVLARWSRELLSTPSEPEAPSHRRPA